jgi:16S rRNA (uracil1498-N3)-methyltransferase
VIATEDLGPGAQLPTIDLCVGFIAAGQRWDTLIDGVVQAGVGSITPVAANARELDRIAARSDRAARVALAAAKQAKRSRVPEIFPALTTADLVDGPPGIVFDTETRDSLIDIEPANRLFVGPVEGIDRAVVDQLVEAGWRRASLGPTVLRSELAAALAVSITIQRLT